MQQLAENLRTSLWRTLLLPNGEFVVQAILCLQGGNNSFIAPSGYFLVCALRSRSIFPKRSFNWSFSALSSRICPC